MLFACDHEFKLKEQSTIKDAGFQTKELKRLNMYHSLAFNGDKIFLSQHSSSVSVTQISHCKKIEKSQQHRGVYHSTRSWSIHSHHLLASSNFRSLTSSTYNQTYSGSNEKAEHNKTSIKLVPSTRLPGFKGYIVQSHGFPDNK